MNPRSDRIAGTILVAFGILVAIESWRMPRFENIGGSIESAPGLVPGLLGVIIAIFSLFLVIKPGQQKKDGLTHQADDDSTHEAPSMTRLLVMLVLSVGFAAGLVGNVPFWLGIFIYVLITILYFEKDRLKQRQTAIKSGAYALVIAALTAAAIPLVFEKLFLVTLP